MALLFKMFTFKTDQLKWFIYYWQFPYSNHAFPIYSSRSECPNQNILSSQKNVFCSERTDKKEDVLPIAHTSDIVGPLLVGGSVHIAKGLWSFQIYPHILRPASHWPIIKESEGPQSVVRSDEICSEYFPPMVSIPLPDCRTKSHIGNLKLPPIVGPKSDMADYRRLLFSPRLPDFSSDFSSDPPILRSNRLRIVGVCAGHYILTKGKFKDKEHLKCRCLVQVDPEVCTSYKNILWCVKPLHYPLGHSCFSLVKSRNQTFS